MNFFRKRETLIQNMTFMALMAALNVIFSLLSTLLPILFFLLVFVLPLTSTLVCIFCKKRYYGIYAVATIGLCLLINFYQITDVISYVIPSIVTGLIFGLMIEHKINSFWTILAAAFVQAVFSYVSIIIAGLFIDRNIIEEILKLLSLEEFAFKGYVTSMFIFIIALIQIAITYLIIREEIKKMGVETNEEPPSIPILSIITVGLTCATIGVSFLHGPTAFIIFGFTIVVGTYLVAYSFSLKKKVLYILAGVSLAVTMLAFTLFDYVAVPNGIYLLDVFFVQEAIIMFSNYYLEKHANKDKME